MTKSVSYSGPTGLPSLIGCTENMEEMQGKRNPEKV